jgi:hypothetical protein
MADIPHIIILGGGFAGIGALKELRDAADWPNDDRWIGLAGLAGRASCLAQRRGRTDQQLCRMGLEHPDQRTLEAHHPERGLRQGR